jgi:hypothetical protein
MFGLTDKITALIFGGLSAILLALCAVLYIEVNGFFWIDGLKDKLENCTRDNNELRAGVKAAEELNRQQVERITQEQKEINDDIEARYKADRERMRVELDKRLRSKAPQGSTGNPQASPDGPPTGGIDEAAPVCIPPSQYVQGAETELQLDTLITWVEQQLGVKR